MHLELSQIRSKEQYAVTALMSVEDRKRVVGNLNRAVLRCKTKHLDGGKHLETQAKDRESRQRARDSLQPSEREDIRLQNRGGMKRMREFETLEQKDDARFQNREGLKRMRDSETPEKKDEVRSKDRKGKQRVRDSEPPDKRQIRLEIARNRKHESGGCSSVAREFEDELTRRREDAVGGMSRRPRELRVDLRGEESSDDNHLSDTYHGNYPSDVSSESEESTDDDTSVAKTKIRRKKKIAVSPTAMGVPESELLSLALAEEIDAGVAFIALDLENSRRIEAEIKDALTHVYTDLVCFCANVLSLVLPVI